MGVKLREKQLSNGQISFYLDIYQEDAARACQPFNLGDAFALILLQVCGINAIFTVHGNSRTLSDEAHNSITWNRCAATSKLY